MVFKFNWVNLPIPTIELIFSNVCKSCPFGMILKVTDSKILFNDVSDFGDFFIPFDFIFSLPGEIAKQMFLEHISLGQSSRGWYRSASGGLFKTIMGFIFLYNPIRVQIPREPFGLSIFVKFTFRRIVFFFQFLEFLVADRPAGGFNESGINSDAFIDGKTLAFELTQDLCASGVFLS